MTSHFSYEPKTSVDLCSLLTNLGSVLKSIWSCLLAAISAWQCPTCRTMETLLCSLNETLEFSNIICQHYMQEQYTSDNYFQNSYSILIFFPSGRVNAFSLKFSEWVSLNLKWSGNCVEENTDQNLWSIEIQNILNHQEEVRIAQVWCVTSTLLNFPSLRS